MVHDGKERRQRHHGKERRQRNDGMSAADYQTASSQLLPIDVAGN